MKVNEFSRYIAGAWRAKEDAEFIVCDDRDASIVRFALECLANEDCAGSVDALIAIVSKRYEQAKGRDK